MGSSQSQPETDTIRITLDNDKEGDIKVSEVRLSQEELRNLNDVLEYSGGSIVVDTDVITEIAGDLGFQTVDPGIEEEYEEEEVFPPEVGYPAYPPYQPFVFPPSDPIGVPPSDPIGVPPSDHIGVPPSDHIGVPPSDPIGMPPSDPVGVPPSDPVGMSSSEPTGVPIDSAPNTVEGNQEIHGNECVFDMPEKEVFKDKIEEKALEDTGCVFDMPEKEVFKEKIEEKALEDTGCIFNMPDKESVDTKNKDKIKPPEIEVTQDKAHVLELPDKVVFVQRPETGVHHKAMEKSEKASTNQEQLANSLFGEFKKQEVEKIIVEAKLEGARSQAKIDAEYMSSVVNSEREKWRSKFTVIDENLRKRKADLASAHSDAVRSVSDKMSFPDNGRKCDNNINEVLKCYSEYPNQVLRCKALVDSFENCVSNALSTR